MKKHNSIKSKRAANTIAKSEENTGNNLSRKEALQNPAARQTAVSPDMLISFSSMTPQDIWQLQRYVGNKAIGHLVANQEQQAEQQAEQESTQHTLVNRKAASAIPIHIPPAITSTQPGAIIQRANDGEIKAAWKKLKTLRKELWKKSELDKKDLLQVKELAALAQQCVMDADYFTSGVLEEIRNLLHDIIQATQEDQHAAKYAPAIQNILTHIPEQVSGELWETLSIWLDARMAGASPEIRMKLIQYMGKEKLERSLRQFIEHRQAEAGPQTAPEQIGEEVETRILKSKTLGKLIAQNYQNGSIAANFVILDDAAFTEKHAEQNREINEDYYNQLEGWEPAIIQAEKIDNVSGFQYQGKMYIRQGETALVTPIHEAIHQLGENLGGKAWKKSLGHHMEEGAVEMLTLQICDEFGIEASYETSGYYNEWLLLDTIMGKCNISQDELKQAYLGGNPSTVVAAIVKHSGEAGFTALAEKESNAAYYAWVDAYLKHNELTLEEANEKKTVTNEV